MKRLFLLCLIIVALPWTLAGWASDAAKQEKPVQIRLRRPIALALADGGKILLAANRDSGTIAVVDTKRLKVQSEMRVGQKLSHMSATPSANVVCVTDEQAGELIVLSCKQGKLLVRQRIKTGISPVSVSVTADGHLAIIACLWPRQLMIFDLKAEQTGDSPRKGATVLDLPFAPRAQLLVADDKLVVADSFGGNLALVDLRRKQVESVRQLDVHNIRGLALDREHKSLLLTHQILYKNGRPNPSEIRSNNLIANQVRRLRLANVLNPQDYLVRDEERYLVGDVVRGAGDPAAVCDGYDGSILVTIAGANELAIGWPKKAMWTRLAVGRRPTALEVDRGQRRAYVANTFADSISVVDLQPAKVVATISLGPIPKLRPEERGEMLFFDARLSFEGWYSCHSCHTDGHTSGRLNDNFTDGSFGTPKRVLSLLGVKDTGKWAWNGQMAHLHDQIRLSLTSTMQGPKPSADQVRDLEAFLRTLQPPPAVAKARRTLDAQAIARGRRVFTERKCIACHKPPTYTSPRTYNVGLQDEAGNTRFNPPSLRGLSQRGPYFHDNRARSLEEVLDRFQHRLAKPLSKQQRSDLLHFLRSL